MHNPTARLRHGGISTADLADHRCRRNLANDAEHLPQHCFGRLPPVDLHPGRARLRRAGATDCGANWANLPGGDGWLRQSIKRDGRDSAACRKPAALISRWHRATRAAGLSIRPAGCLNGDMDVRSRNADHGSSGIGDIGGKCCATGLSGRCASDSRWRAAGCVGLVRLWHRQRSARSGRVSRRNRPQILRPCGNAIGHHGVADLARRHGHPVGDLAEQACDALQPAVDRLQAVADLSQRIQRGVCCGRVVARDLDRCTADEKALVVVLEHAGRCAHRPMMTAVDAMDHARFPGMFYLCLNSACAIALTPQFGLQEQPRQ